MQLPFDEHEGAAPAAIAAQMMLFRLVTDALEQSESEDSGWLDSAVSVLAVADEPARFDLRDVLAAIDHDYTLTLEEHSRIRAAVAPIAERDELRDLKLGSVELHAHVVSIVEACRHYKEVLEKTADRL